jgi:outer membrane protein OmpA-like peptidoglycan-associated protein/type II secretory pathway predicted ATPase ExeA
MFNTFYKLMFEPFAEAPYSKFFWVGENQKAALGGMKKNILANSQGVILLVGDEGQGKSTLIDILINRIKEFVNFGRIRKDDNEERLVFLVQLARSMGLKIETSSRTDFFREFGDHLTRLYTNSQKNSLLIIENGQALTQELLDDLAQISSITVNGRKIVNILLVGDRNLLKAIESSSDTTLRESLLFLCKTNKLSKQDSIDYIKHRLKIAGSSEPIFTEQALAEIYSQTLGNLNSINKICTEAISLGTLKKQDIIDADIIFEAVSPKEQKEVYIEQRVSTQPAADQQVAANPEKKDQTASPSFLAARVFPLYATLAICCLVMIFFSATFIANKKSGQYPVESMLADQVQSPDSNLHAITADINPEKKTQKVAEVVRPEQQPHKAAEVVHPEKQPQMVAEVVRPKQQPHKAAEVVHPEKQSHKVAEVVNEATLVSKQSPAEPANETAAPEVVEQLNTLVSPASGSPAEITAAASTKEKNSAVTVSEMLVIESKQQAPSIVTMENQPELYSVAAAAVATDSFSTLLEKSRHTIESKDTLLHIAAVKKKKILVLPKSTLILQAKPNSDTITDEAMKQLQEFTSILQLYPEKKILIEGYIASDNDTPANTQLSQRRADNIRQIMIKHGAKPEQLQAIGRGNHKPLASNDTAIGKKKNRRIEISVVTDPSDNVEIARQ